MVLSLPSCRGASPASAAHGEHEKRIGKHDATGWPDWYGEYIVREQAGKPLPE
jgi:hypothetical protein